MAGDPSAWAYAAAAPGPLVIGFSGGGDSCALLAEAAARRLPCLAVIVDHGLRPGSDADADRAAAIAAHFGVPVERVRLAGLSGGQDEARQARHAALCTIAHRRGARVIALGHTQDDQAETVLMRLARGAGPRGLAAMAAVDWSPLWPEGRRLAVIRPLLFLPRTALRVRLRDIGCPWLEDPANTAPRYLRSAARTIVQADPSLRDRLATVAARLRAIMDRQDAALLGFAHAAVQIDPSGRAALDWAALIALDAPDQSRLLACLVTAVSGAPRLPQPAAIARVWAQLSTTPGLRTTLAGAWISRRGGRLIAEREPAASTGRQGQPPVPSLPLVATDERVFDGRFVIIAHRAGLHARLAGGAPSPAAVQIVDDAGQPANDHATVIPLAQQRLRRLLARPAHPAHAVTSV